MFKAIKRFRTKWKRRYVEYDQIEVGSLPRSEVPASGYKVSGRV